MRSQLGIYNAMSLLASPHWRDDFDRYPKLWTAMERVLCPRVHFKCIIVDGVKAYFGSANLTGAGLIVIKYAHENQSGTRRYNDVGG